MFGTSFSMCHGLWEPSDCSVGSFKMNFGKGRMFKEKFEIESLIKKNIWSIQD